MIWPRQDTGDPGDIFTVHLQVQVESAFKFVVTMVLIMDAGSVARRQEIPVEVPSKNSNLWTNAHEPIPAAISLHFPGLFDEDGKMSPPDIAQGSAMKV